MQTSLDTIICPVTPSVPDQITDMKVAHTMGPGLSKGHHEF